MRKVIAAINMTVDGYCDHTAVDPDAEIHDHYTALLKNAGVILYGRITYQLMEFWRTIIEHPSGNRSMDEFAAVMNDTPKLVFSTQLKQTGWHSATLARQAPAEEVKELLQQPGKDIYVGSPSLINELTNQQLINEYQLCIHPVLAGAGKPLFSGLAGRTALMLTGSKTFKSGAIILYYAPAVNG